jgi:hypothetical protein
MMDNQVIFSHHYFNQQFKAHIIKRTKNCPIALLQKIETFDYVLKCTFVFTTTARSLGISNLQNGVCK